MKMHSLLWKLAFLLVLIFLPGSIADLKSDKQALLNFAAAVPHSRKLNWKSSTSVCTSWIGISCDKNSSHVLAVRLPGIGLYGPIPANTLEKLDSLMILSMRSNGLSGEIPSDLLSIPSLRNVHLQKNNLSGSIPSSLSPQLNLLDLSFNSLSGDIPSTMQNLTHLTSLSLQNNSLSGSIPELNVTVLKQLNLSNNHLNGSIPSDLQRFPVSSFQGNAKLCGTPLNQCSNLSPSPSPSPSRSPSPSPSPSTNPSPSVPSHSPTIISLPPLVPQKPKEESKKKLSKGSTIGIAIGGSALVLFLLLIMVMCCLKKKDGEGKGALEGKGGKAEKPKEDFGSGVQNAEKNKLVFFEGCSYNFDLEDLLRASAEVLGKGSYGTTYKAILEEGTTVVVKRLKEVVVGKKEFDQQMENVGRIRQLLNVLPLRAYYFSKDEKLLVYDYAPAGSFSASLHGNREIGRNSLDWESRVKISLGTAKGISHIHSAGGGKLVHGNIKSSNVLLTQDLQASVSDFGLASLLSYPSVPSRSAGYRAPEVIDARKSTQKSDVYSFGVLLLEMLTGKAPVQSSGHDNIVDLPRWVQSVVREEWTAEVFDVELVKYQNIEEEMVQMLQIAMSCVATVPEMRPTMEEVVRMIEELRTKPDSETQTSPEENEDSNVESLQ